MVLIFLRCVQALTIKFATAFLYMQEKLNVVHQDESEGNSFPFSSNYLIFFFSELLTPSHIELNAFTCHWYKKLCIWLCGHNIGGTIYSFNRTLHTSRLRIFLSRDYSAITSIPLSHMDIDGCIFLFNYYLLKKLIKLVYFKIYSALVSSRSIFV